MIGGRRGRGLPAHRRSRPRRHGRGVSPPPPPAARSTGGGEGAAGPSCRSIRWWSGASSTGAASAIRHRGIVGSRLRFRRQRRFAYRDGAAGRRSLAANWRAVGDRFSKGLVAGAALDRGRARRLPTGPDRPSRPQARQRVPRPRRRGQTGERVKLLCSASPSWRRPWQPWRPPLVWCSGPDLHGARAVPRVAIITARISPRWAASPTRWRLASRRSPARASGDLIGPPSTYRCARLPGASVAAWQSADLQLGQGPAGALPDRRPRVIRAIDRLAKTRPLRWRRR